MQAQQVCRADTFARWGIGPEILAHARPPMALAKLIEFIHLADQPRPAAPAFVDHASEAGAIRIRQPWALVLTQNSERPRKRRAFCVAAIPSSACSRFCPPSVPCFRSGCAAAPRWNSRRCSSRFPFRWSLPGTRCVDRTCTGSAVSKWLQVKMIPSPPKVILPKVLSGVNLPPVPAEYYIREYS